MMEPHPTRLSPSLIAEYKLILNSLTAGLDHFTTLLEPERRLGSFDLDETEDQGSVGSDAFTTPLAWYKPHDDHLGLRRRRRTNGSDAFTTPLAQYKPHDDHLGLRRRRRTNVSFSEETHNKLIRIMGSDAFITPLAKTPSPKFHISKFLNCISFRGSVVDQIYQTLKKIEPQLFNKPRDDHCVIQRRRIKLPTNEGTLDFTSWVSDDGLLHRLIDLVGGVVSAMLPPPTVIAAAGTACNLNLATASVVTAGPRHREVLSTASVVTARHTEQRSLLHHCIDNMPGGNSNDERKGCIQKMDFEWIFVITNVVLQSLSAIFLQLSSKQKPQYALYGMVVSYIALLTCSIEIIYEGLQQIPIERGTLSNNRSQRDEIIYEGHQQIPVQRGTLSDNQPQRGKSFATLKNIVALACVLGECVITTINYKFDSPIKVTALPIILANGVLFSKILKY